MAKGFITNCPNCGSKLSCGEKESMVTCFACDSVFEAASLKGGTSAPANATGGFLPLAMVAGFDNPESSIVFLESFFSTYIWDEYYESNELFIAGIEEVVKNNKIKNGAVAQSWYLDFKALAFPISKKLEGLVLKQNEIIEKYNPDDDSDAYSAFDIYRRITNLLIENREFIVKYLETALSYAQRFKLASSLLDEMASDLKRIKSSLNALTPVEMMTDLNAFNTAREAFNKTKAAKYAAMGLDALTTYNQALELLNQGNSSGALLKFESIREYSNSAEYVRKINEYFNFENELFYFFGNYYIYEMGEQKSAPLDIKSKNGGSADGSNLDSSGVALSLYSVENGVPSEAPVITGIDKFIGCYNNKYYYFKKGCGIYCYDFSAQRDLCLDSGTSADYKIDGEYEFNFVLNKSAVIVKKKLKYSQKQGCLTSKKKSASEFRLNNFNLILVDFKSNSVRTVINEMVDIADLYADKIFYSYAEKISKAKKSGVSKSKASNDEMPEFKTILRVCDLNTGEDLTVLNEDCEIHAVKGDKVVYSLWTPNSLNRDLFVYDMKTQIEVLIEDNVYNYFGIINDEIYYTVGNADYCALVRNSFDGKSRLEVLNQVSNVVGVIAGWLYVKKGYGKNAVLVKISSDGSKRIVVCTQYSKSFTITSSHIHYLDTENCLRVVRSDGNENRKIADNIDWVIVNEKNIYYSRTEQVDDKNKTRSLYRMDKEGRNIKKIAFGIDNAVDYDENALYFSRELTIRFKVTIPPEKKHGEPEVYYENYNVTRYYLFDKSSEQTSVVLTLGLPHGTKTFKRGCLKKEVEEEIIYTEEPIKCAYKRKGLKAPGAVESEQIQEFEDRRNGGDSLGSSSFALSQNAGCLSAFSSSNKSSKRVGGGKKKSKSSNKRTSSSGNGNKKVFPIIFIIIAVALIASGVYSIISYFNHSHLVGVNNKPLTMIKSGIGILVSIVLLILSGKYLKRGSCAGLWRTAKISSTLSLILRLVLVVVIIIGTGGIGCREANSKPGINGPSLDSQEPGASFETAIPTVDGANDWFDSDETIYYSFIPQESSIYQIILLPDRDCDLDCVLFDRYGNEIASANSDQTETHYGMFIELNNSETYYLMIYARQGAFIDTRIDCIPENPEGGSSDDDAIRIRNNSIGYFFSNGQDVWFAFTVYATGDYSITSTSFSDPQATLYASNEYGDIYSIATNDDYANGLDFCMNAELDSNRTYYLLVTARNADYITIEIK